jgi:presenilin-like A22 family membrane protease
MKHTLKVTLILVMIFFLAQIAGLVVTGQYMSVERDKATGEVVNVTYGELPIGMERPEVEESSSFIYILIAVLVGTGIVLLLIKFKGYRLWKFWFFFAVSLCLIVAFSAFASNIILKILAILLAVGLALWKTWRPNVYIHNLTEIFIYGGLAAIFVPIMNVWAAVLMLILISIYDMIAVWQSKHMVKMAKFQTQSNVFAGLSIPYKLPFLKPKKAEKKSDKKVSGKMVKVEGRNAILGGGDIGFPLLFAGVLMKQAGFLKVLIVPAMATVALFLLLYFAKKDRFYPAMPFISAGCFVGWGVLWIITHFL